MKNFVRQATTLTAIFLASVSAPTWSASASEVSLHGDYIVTALRRASDVSASAQTDADAFSLGDTISFGETLTWLDGTTCESWRVESAPDAGIHLDDPNLSDVAIAPLDRPDERLAKASALQLFCNDDALIDITQVDSRVIVIQSPAGAMYAILEKPLSSEQIERLQFVLRDMKFYDGAMSGELDEATRNAVSIYADYRGAEYVFKDAVITENLLDGLQVLMITDVD